MTDDFELISAATVLLLRDTSEGPEVLMLRRNSEIAFGGAWVFPGGRVDVGEADHDELATARRAAVRECQEEAGLVVSVDELVTWSHWQPPVASVMSTTRGPRRRFSTWFFATAAPTGDVVIDDGEIHEHRWLTSASAMDLHRRGEIELVPPTWVTLMQLGAHPDSASAMRWASAQTPPRFHTKHLPADVPTLTWEPDVFHAGGGPEDSGPRHRLALHPEGWRYERS